MFNASIKSIKSINPMSPESNDSRRSTRSKDLKIGLRMLEYSTLIL